MVPDSHAFFMDATALTRERAKDIITGKTIKVPGGDILVAGFPCTDVSIMNPHCKENRAKVEKGGLSTGSVFKAIDEFLTLQESVIAAVLENVLGLSAGKDISKSNLAVVLQQLGIRFFVRAYHLNACWSGLPQSRPRIYIVALRRTWLDAHATTPEKAATMLDDLIRTFVDPCHPVTPLERFLLDDHDLSVKDH